ncbi:Putative uncharacterized protein [Taphrina deformans PYCC 5710]|uniref:BRCT domain-containing protein n=1 Tax=Taphrina deformans (strain PYCC 5710 / ATCC 11124 / CBS 356.35 / IMI 108563 / JCM 9778 / NBRC 8474) TaxID=1097556 RepID=R4XEI9_TAPDE|nr:Putative uncharacterized protein [Taphrina deformans PYCC 5710]|eukprot:CCG82891.1 Putative uncharacterized protein [Taphrina deformans PYCC 5710]
MDKYLNITKSAQTPTTAKRKSKHVDKKMTLKEHIMHVATTPTTGGHDIWQSASTGHQVSEAGAKCVSYNEARLAKLQAQFPPRQPLKRDHDPSAETDQDRKDRDSGHISLFDYNAAENTWHPSPVRPIPSGGSGIFSGCVFYLDGYMGSKMSDHTLRRVLTLNGGTLSLYLKKTRITHVLLSSRGALANSKIKREVEGSRNRVKFVRIDWVHKCLEVGRRIGEWEYSVDRLCGGNRTVASMLSHPADSTVTAHPEQTPSEEETVETKRQLDLLGAEEGERWDAIDR